MNNLWMSIYNGILRFIPIKKYIKFQSNLDDYLKQNKYFNYETKIHLENSLGITIHNIEYFEQALIHRSFLQTLPNSKFISNERLEFLGDAILGFIVAEFLYKNYPNSSEGELTKLRSLLVNKDSLIRYSKSLELDRYLLLSYSAAKSLQSGNESILADVFEAIVAAIYLDSGIDTTKSFIFKTIVPVLSDSSFLLDKNYKSNLLELLQANGLDFPKYVVLDEKGPQHDKEFIVGVYVNDIFVGTGKGKTKKQAEQDAALNALNNPLLEEIFKKSISNKKN